MLSTLYLVAALSLGAAAQSDGLTVKTQQGTVQGFQSSSAVRAFLGIPYATAGRWEAPQLPPVRNSTFNATKFGDGCLQTLSPVAVKGSELLGLSVDRLNVPSSENCLSVNVWAPATSRKKKTAVILFIHGGLYQFGTSNSPYFTGGNFVQNNDDITFVTFNYRLNIYGQPNAPQLFSTTKSQNFGFLDMEAGIQWVHDNIAAFGGDPERITLVGQSSTGGSVESYTFNHPNSTFIKGVVRLSGVDFTTPYGSDGKVDPSPWNKVASAVGCGTTVNDTQFQCMKNLPADKMSAAYLASGLTLFPLTDGLTLYADQASRGSAGNFLKVPFFVGGTQHELDAGTVPQQLVAINRTIPVIAEILSDLETIVGYTCTASTTALYHFNAGVPVWRYLFQGIFRDFSSIPELRSYHLADVPSWFGTYTESPVQDHTTIEKAFSSYNQGALAAFARDPQAGLTQYGWPKYDPAQKTLVQLGGFYNYTGAYIGDPSAWDSPCSNLAAIEAATAALAPLLIPGAGT